MKLLYRLLMGLLHAIAMVAQNVVANCQLLADTFTYFLLKGLAKDTDGDTNNILTVNGLRNYLVPGVRIGSGGKQAPVFFRRFSDRLPLTYF